MEFKLESASPTQAKWVNEKGSAVVFFPKGKSRNPDLRVLASKALSYYQIEAVIEAHKAGKTRVTVRA